MPNRSHRGEIEENNAFDHSGTILQKAAVISRHYEGILKIPASLQELFKPTGTLNSDDKTIV